MRGKGICIVGCGAYAAAHAREFGKLRGVRLYFASRSPRRAREYAKRFKGEGLGGFEAALADSRVDGVVLCGPHDRHFPDAAAALRAGKSVLLEKPLARTVAEGRRLAAAARRRRGAQLMLAENFAFLPHLAPLRRALKGMGRVEGADAVHLRLLKVRGWRLSRERMGGGILIDMGVHYLRLLAMLLGPAARVRCRRFARPIRRMEGESEIDLRLEYRSGAQGTLLLSWASDVEPWVDELKITAARGTVTAALRKPRVRAERERGGRVFAVPWKDPRGRGRVARAFLRCLRGGRPEVGVREGLDDLRVVAAAYASAASGGRWRRV